MVKMHLELEGEADDVVRTLRRICGVAPDVDPGHAGAPIAPAEHNQSELVAVLEPETTASAGAPPLARWTEELAGDFMAALDPVARRMALHVWRAGAAGNPSERPVPACGADAGGAALVADADGPRASAVPAGTGDDAAPAGGGQQPAAELLRRSRFRRSGGVPDVWGEYAGPAGLRRGAPLMASRRGALGRANRAPVVDRADDNGLLDGNAGLRGGRR